MEGKTLDWSNERYVRLYTRDTKTWLLLGWEGQCVFSLILRKVDRAGVLDDIRDGADLAVIFSNGFPIELAQVGLDRLISTGVVELTNSGLVIPNFIEAQETAMSNGERCRKYRETRRDRARATQNVSRTTQNMSSMTRGNTGRHEATHADTPNLTTPNCTVPNEVNKKSARKRFVYPDWFEQFMKIYPNRTNKKAAYDACLKAQRSHGCPEGDALLNIVKEQCTWEKWQNGYVLTPDKWFRRGCWDDERPSEPRGPETNAQAMRRRTVEALGIKEETGELFDHRGNNNEDSGCDISVIPRKI
jgi:hypothetical protein